MFYFIHSIPFNDFHNLLKNYRNKYHYFKKNYLLTSTDHKLDYEQRKVTSRYLQENKIKHYRSSSHITDVGKLYKQNFLLRM